MARRGNGTASLQESWTRRMRSCSGESRVEDFGQSQCRCNDGREQDQDQDREVVGEVLSDRNITR